MPRIIFSITPYLISKSRKLLKVQGMYSNRSEACPTALAIKKVLGKKVRVEVACEEVILSKAESGSPDGYFSVTLSKKVRKFIETFDNENAWNGVGHDNPKAQPLAFTLNIPKQILA